MGSDTGFNTSEVIDGIDRLYLVISASQRQLLRYIREADSRGVWISDGCRDMGQWLSGRLGIPWTTADLWTKAAYRLESLPLTSEALEKGELSLDKAVHLARFATPEDERDLIKWAKRVTVATIRQRAEVANRPSLEETQREERWRYLRWWFYEDRKRFGLETYLPGVDGMKIAEALERMVAELPVDPDARDENDEFERERRYADALIALATSKLSADDKADRAAVVVHAELSALLGDSQGCEIENGPVIHPEVARRLCCDARIQTVVYEGGKAIGIGWTSRNIPRWLERQLRHRDRCCQFPGCGSRRYLQGHHIIPWPIGPTELDNLTLLCSFHHKLVHEHGWRVRLDEHQMTEWYRPDGTRFEPKPRGQPALARAS